MQGTVVLTRLKTEIEVIEHTAAVIQLYREEAQYLHRMYKWMDLVGLDHITERVVTDADSRAELAARFFYSQQFAQDDPWAERTTPDYRRAYAPLADLTLEAAE